MKQEQETPQVTPEQIAEWKAKYGAIYEIDVDGRGAIIIFDPLSSLPIMKQAFMALNKSSVQYVASVLNNCHLHGDKSALADDAVLFALVDKIDEITELPECQVSKKGNKYVMRVEGHELEVRGASREDLIRSEDKNPQKQPFETAIHLLNRIALDKDKLDAIRKDTRIYIGFLTGTEKVKEKASVLVKKL